MFRSKPDVVATKDRLSDTWESARVTLAPRVDAARDALAPRITAARGVVAPYVEEATARLTPALDEARAKVAPAVGTAIERIAPAVDTARTKLRDDVAPAVAAAVDTARESSAPARAEAKERAANALLALQGKTAKTRRWPTALIFLGAGALAGLAAGILTRTKRPSTTAAFPPAPVTPFPAPTPPLATEEPADDPASGSTPTSSKS